jgi:hypothetical protein
VVSSLHPAAAAADAHGALARAVQSANILRLTFGAAETCIGSESLYSSASADGLPGRSSSSSLPLQA